MDQLKRLLAHLTLKQKLTLAIAAIAVIGGLTSFLRWRDAQDYVPLYSGMAPEDAAAVVARLRESGGEYKLEDNGARILVRSQKAAELRLQLAAAGLPKSGRIGFELFDKTNFGATEFAEQINYHRALEGELERSVMSLAEVELARVHITRAKDSVFSESRQPAKASVLVKLRPGANLAASNVQSITHLVASAVEGLTPNSVSVVDVRGNLLSRPRQPLATGSGGSSDGMLDYRMSVERDLLAKINGTLEPLLGPDKFRAGVTVDCDFTSGEQSEEVFDPERSVMAQSQRTEDVSGAAATAAGGVPGTASNLARPAAPRSPVAGGGLARRTENISYQSSRTVRRTQLPQGTVKRISVALLVDHQVRFEGSGAKLKRIVEAPTAERLKSVKDLVSGVAGLVPDRGDQIVVESLPFESTLHWEQPTAPGATPAAPPGIALPAWLMDAMQKGNKVVLIAAAAGALLALLIPAIVLLWLRGRRKGKIQATMANKALAGGQRAAIEPGQSLEEMVGSQMADREAQRHRQEQEILNELRLPPVTTKKGEVLAKHLAEEAKKTPDSMAHVLRTWVTEGDVERV